MDSKQLLKRVFGKSVGSFGEVLANAEAMKKKVQDDFEARKAKILSDLDRTINNKPDTRAKSNKKELSSSDNMESSEQVDMSSC